MTPQHYQDVLRAAASFGARLEEGTVGRLESYLELLKAWSRTTRLVGDPSDDALVHRHVIDSLAVLPHLPTTGRVADIGSGAGFPGLVLACSRPEADVLLVEPRRRRASFLRDVARRVPLPGVSIAEARAEDLRAAATGNLGATISRALRLDHFLGVSWPLLQPGGLAVAMQTAQAALFDVEQLGAARQFSLVDTSDYELPDGRARRILVFQTVA